ncbi:hypothetical protein WP50_38730 [Lactiplantibacillus plantarum]|nr:hypothetical protein WP50_38730 [Lactiplantibacillus plantarum]
MLAAKGAKVVLGARREERLQALSQAIGDNAVYQVTDVTDRQQVRALIDLAKLLAAKGAKVVLGARREERLQALSQAIGDNAVYQVTDVTDRQQVRALIDLAKLLAAKGAKVVLGARREERLQALSQAIGDNAVYQVTDVTDRQQVRALIDLAKLLAAKGAKVVLGARREERLQALSQAIGDNAVYQVTDVTDRQQVRALIDLAKLLAAKGAKVVLGARREERLQALSQAIGDNAVYQVTDVTDRQQVRALIDLAKLLAAKGAKVVLGARREERLQALSQAIGDLAVIHI